MLAAETRVLSGAVVSPGAILGKRAVVEQLGIWRWCAWNRSAWLAFRLAWRTLRSHLQPWSRPLPITPHPKKRRWVIEFF
jgi:hypothetical protein